jgi:hypothetical protein
LPPAARVSAQPAARPTATGDSAFLIVLHELKDPQSDLQRQWDQEHDQYILARMLASARKVFSEQDFEAFCRIKLRKEPAASVAASLGIASLARVYMKVSRVLAWLQQEAQGLLDESFF